MIRRCLLLLVVGALVAACSSPPDSAPSTKLVTSSPAPSGSPDVPTPTAIIALPAPPSSPSPSPSPSPSALAAASPVAAPSPIASPPAANAPDPANGPRYAIVANQSQAAYRARETFVGQAGPSDAVGTTNQVSGAIQLDRDGLLRGRVLGMKIDVRTLLSGSARRDAYLRDNTLQAAQFPFVEFRSTATAGPAEYQAPDEVSFQIPGLMTIRGQERPIVWEGRARLDGDTLVGAATARVKLTDFGLTPPRLAVLSVEDEMSWEIEIVARRVP